MVGRWSWRAARDDGSLPVRGRGHARPRPGGPAAAGARRPGLWHALGQALFRDGLRDAFGAARAGAARRGCSGCCSTIEEPDLRTLRWERLCAPLDGRWSFLALDQRAALLALPAEPHRPALPALRPARPAGARVVASPDGLDDARPRALRCGGHRRGRHGRPGRRSRRRAGGGRGRGRPADARRARCEHLTAAPYTLLHIVCHGRSARGRDGETSSPSRGPTARSTPVSATALIERLAGLGGARGLPHLGSCRCATAPAPRPRARSAAWPSASCATWACRPWWP